MFLYKSKLFIVKSLYKDMPNVFHAALNQRTWHLFGKSADVKLKGLNKSKTPQLQQHYVSDWAHLMCGTVFNWNN